MIKTSQPKYSLLVVIAIGVLLLGYSVSRAVLISITHDESCTYLWFVPESFMQIVSLHIPKAGNHIINTLAIKLSTSIFPDNEFFVRLPNLIAHFFYLLFSILFLKRFRNPILFIGGFILLNFNPYMLEYFALGRGYGLSLAFLAGSVFWFVKYNENNKNQHLYLTLILGALSAISNFIFIHYYLSIIIVYNLIQLTNSGLKGKISSILKTLFKKNIPTILVSAILAFILFEPIRKLSKFNEFYGQGQTGFYKNSVISFIHGSKYNQDYGSVSPEIISYVLLAIVGFIFIAIFIDLYRKNFVVRDSLSAISLIFVISPIITINLQHYILGSEFPTFRLTLIFVPLLGFGIIAAFLSFNKPAFRNIYLSIIVLISLLLTFHLVRSINWAHTYEWQYDADTKKMIEILENDFSEKNTETPIKLGINWVFEPSINFFRITKNYNWLQTVTRDGFNGDYDYYYVFKDNLPEIKNVEIIKEFETSNTILLKKTK
jgi:hypothetical protein